MNKAEFQEKYNELLPTLDRVRTSVFGIISNEIGNSEVSSLPIQSRVKEWESAENKFTEKGYNDPLQEMTDLVAFRVVVYLESDVSKVEEILRNAFEIDENNSTNKRKPKSVDSVGYRSLHLICKLGQDRRNLPEYSGLCNQKFEIQVRTALEHTWAEIEHGQNYKSQHALPSSLQRRLNIISGTLELLDRELSEISIEASKYQSQVVLGEDSIQEDSITASSIIAICKNYGEKNGVTVDQSKRPDYDDLIEELNSSGIETVSDLKASIEALDIANYPHDGDISVIGMTRTAIAARGVVDYYKNILEPKDIRIPQKVLDYLEHLDIEGVEEVRALQDAKLAGTP